MKRFTLKSGYDDLSLAVAVSLPKDKPLAVIQLVHGMCGCKERFRPLMNFLSDNGIVCIAADLRGHGESVKDINDLGYFYSGGYKALVADIKTIVDWGLKEFCGLPYYLLGHSMGSLAARVYAKQNDSTLSGLIVCGSPSWNPLSVVGRFLTGIACLMGFGRSRSKLIQMFTSDVYNKKFVSEGTQAWTCSDPEARKSARENPLCNFRFTMNGANNLMKMMGETYCHKGWKVSQPTMPILFISGSDDACMISEQKFYNAVNFMHKVGYQNVSSLIYPKMRHEVLNEVGKQKVWSDVLDFIKGTPK